MYKKIAKLIGSEDEELKQIVGMYERNRVSVESLIFYIKQKHGLNDSNADKLKVVIGTNKPIEVNNKDIKISVIIPTYKRVDMLIVAINSVLAQSYKNYEIIIVDDCSPDNTREVIGELQKTNDKILYHRNKFNLHAGLSRNTGYKLATGDYIVYLDDDDYYTDSEFFSKMINVHEEFPELSFVSANAFIYSESASNIKLSNINFTGHILGRDYLNEFQMKLDKAPSTFTTLFKKKSLDAIDFDSMKMMNDSSIFLRALLVGDGFILEDIVGVYNIHKENITSNLPLEFMIKNFEEKLWVYDYLLANKIIEFPNIWIKEQLTLTISYFLYGSNPGKEDIRSLLDWFNINLPKVVKKRIIMAVYKNYMINKLKRLFRQIISKKKTSLES